MNRKFTASGPDQTWVADVTYVPTVEGWLYLATVLDVFSRPIVGWSMDSNRKTRLVCDAVAMAVANRGGKVVGVVHHSDRGGEYTSRQLERELRKAGALASMGSVADCYDNSMAEAFFASLETELFWAQPRAQIRLTPRGEARDLRLHRSVLQPAAPTHLDRIDPRRSPTRPDTPKRAGWQHDDPQQTRVHRTGSAPFGRPLDPTTGQNILTDAPTTRTNGPTDAWHGQQQRGYENQGGSSYLLMGAHIYLPALGQFTSPDPILGGNSNPYTYPTDPVNGEDLTGQDWPGLGYAKKHAKAIGVGAAIAVVTTAGVAATVVTLGTSDEVAAGADAALVGSRGAESEAASEEAAAAAEANAAKLRAELQQAKVEAKPRTEDRSLQDEAQDQARQDASKLKPPQSLDMSATQALTLVYDYDYP